MKKPKRIVDQKYRTKQALSIKTDKMIVYRSGEGRKLSQRQLDVLQNNWRKVDYNGYLSRQTRAKIMNMLTGWADSINVHRKYCENYEDSKKRRLRFLTLTLSEPQNMLDNQIKRKALMPFIQKLKEMFHVEHYFWRAEAQKNGNIHFHLIIDSYIKKSEVNYQWDVCQWNAGMLKQKPIYNGGYHTASTRIEAVQGERAVAGYVIKYVTKEDGSRKIFGRVWGCSDSLRNVSTPLVDFDNEVAAELTKAECSKAYDVCRGDFTIVHRTSLLYDKYWEYSELRTRVENYYYGMYLMLYE